MKLRINTVRPSNTSLSQLNAGEVFVLDSCTYLKMQSNHPSFKNKFITGSAMDVGDSNFVLNLETMQIIVINADCEVYPVNAHMDIEVPEIYLDS